MSEAGRWDEFDRWWDAKNRSTIVVVGDSSIDLSVYKVCVDDRVHGTGVRFEHLAPPNSVYTRVEGGVHRVQLRERVPLQKVDRLVSNTVEIKLPDDEEICLRASMCDGQPELQVEEESRTGTADSA